MFVPRLFVSLPVLVLAMLYFGDWDASLGNGDAYLGVLEVGVCLFGFLLLVRVNYLLSWFLVFIH